MDDLDILIAEDSLNLQLDSILGNKLAYKDVDSITTDWTFLDDIEITTEDNTGTVHPRLSPSSSDITSCGSDDNGYILSSETKGHCMNYSNLSFEKDGCSSLLFSLPKSDNKLQLISYTSTDTQHCENCSVDSYNQKEDVFSIPKLNIQNPNRPSLRIRQYKNSKSVDSCEYDSGIGDSISGEESGRSPSTSSVTSDEAKLDTNVYLHGISRSLLDPCSSILPPLTLIDGNRASKAKRSNSNKTSKSKGKKSKKKTQTKKSNSNSKEKTGPSKKLANRKNSTAKRKKHQSQPFENNTSDLIAHIIQDAEPLTSQPAHIKHRQKRKADDLSDSKRYNFRTSSVINRIEVDQRKETPKQPKPKTRPPPLSKYRRKTANARERTRMTEINDGFEHLQALFPQLPKGKLTKITTLRLAINYIRALREMLGYEEDISNVSHEQVLLTSAY